MAISYSKLGETHSSLGNLEKALTYFEEDLKITKELYESHPNNVGFKNGLAISYIKLGFLFVGQMDNKNKGLEKLEMARTILKALKDEYPLYQEFTRNYNWLIEKIKNIE